MIPPPPPPPMTRLPNPGVTERGHVHCNVPLEGVPGIYCDRLVKRNPDGSSRGHRRKPHRFEWRTS